MGLGQSRLQNYGPAWLYIIQTPVKVSEQGYLVTKNSEPYLFEMAGKAKLQKHTYANYYYIYQFTDELKLVFEDILSMIEKNLKLKITVFGYSREKGTLLLYSKEEIIEPYFSALVSFGKVNVYDQRCVLHLKFEKIMPYKNYASILSVNLCPIAEE